MKKYRLSTTISMRHWALLKKHGEKFESQQKVLEHALECLDNNLNQNRILTPEEELWLMLGKVKSACLVQKDGFRVLLETIDFDRFTDYVASQKPLEFVIEYFCQKPLKECSLKEIMDALVFNGQVSNQFDKIEYSDDGDHYTLKLIHDLGMNNSKMLKIIYDSVFTSYGVKTDTNISGRSLFIKIYKN